MIYLHVCVRVCVCLCLCMFVCVCAHARMCVFVRAGARVVCIPLCVFMCTWYITDKDGELVWEQLTVNEREEFQKMLSDGRIGHLLDSYTPWWKVSSVATLFL